jgi:hypothetical protein
MSKRNEKTDAPLELAAELLDKINSADVGIPREAFRSVIESLTRCWKPCGGGAKHESRRVKRGLVVVNPAIGRFLHGVWARGDAYSTVMKLLLRTFGV